jgi:hypothetical protein
MQIKKDRNIIKYQDRIIVQTCSRKTIEDLESRVMLIQHRSRTEKKIFSFMRSNKY